jgi:raffinose/stachyose/melibiose transport system substrate-binding protein
MKKTIVLLSVLMCAALIGRSYTADKKVTISFWHSDVQDDDRAEWRRMADEFIKLHPNVVINITALDEEQFRKKMTAAMRSGKLPDIFKSAAGSVMNEYARKGLLRDITDEVKTTEWGKSIGIGVFSVYSYMGRYYGAPYDMGALGIWYNKKIFARIGLKPFATWSELLAGVRKIKAAGVVPIALGEGDIWPGHFWWAYLAVRTGGMETFYRTISGKGSFTDPAFIQAGERLKELVDLQPFQPGFLGARYDEEAALVGSGKAAMELMGHWAPGVQAVNSPDKKGLGGNLGWFPFPAVEGGKGLPTDLIGGGSGLILGKTAPDEALEFIQFIISRENNARLAGQGKIIPVVRGAEQSLKDENARQIAAAVAHAVYYQLYYDQYLPLSTSDTLKEAVREILAGTKTPEEAARMIDRSFADSFKQ